MAKLALFLERRTQLRFYAVRPAPAAGTIRELDGFGCGSQEREVAGHVTARGIVESRKHPVSPLCLIASRTWARASKPAIRGGNKNYSCPAPR
jgi:hypothetical protein